MSTQIVYAVRSFQNSVLSVDGANFRQPATLGGQGIPRDDDLLAFWGLRKTADTVAVTSSVEVTRTITLAMGPSSAATGTVTTDSGGLITAVVITGQGQDYIQPPVPVIADSGKGAGAIVGPCALQVLATTQIYAGGAGYTNPTCVAVGGLAPGGTAALFSVTTMGGAITAITCTNTTTNGPYAQVPMLVIADPTGTGASWIARCGVHPKVPVIYGGSTFYSGPTISFTPYFKTVCPDASPTAQGAAVRGFMLGKTASGSLFPTFELAPVVS